MQRSISYPPHELGEKNVRTCGSAPLPLYSTLYQRFTSARIAHFFRTVSPFAHKTAFSAKKCKSYGIRAEIVQKTCAPIPLIFSRFCPCLCTSARLHDFLSVFLGSLFQKEEKKKNIIYPPPAAVPLGSPHSCPICFLGAVWGSGGKGVPFTIYNLPSTKYHSNRKL